MMLRFRVASLLLLLSIFTALSMWGQSAGTGALTGTVSDPSNAVIANATVTVSNLDTNQSRTETTGANGSYRFNLLPPGNYKVTISAEGFKTFEVPSLTIDVATTPVIYR